MKPMRLLAISIALLAAFSSLHAATAATDVLAPSARWSAYTSGLATVPPMGWSSWNAFATDIDEGKIVGSAQRIVDSGLASKGYRYINIDDGWWLKRRLDNNRLIIRSTRFPSSIQKNGDPSFRPLTDRLHKMGLKAGIYSDLGRNTCSQAYSTDESDLPKGGVLEREVGLYGHIAEDIHLYFTEWGFDFIKVDGCGLRAFSEANEKVRSGRYRALKPLLDLGAVSRSDIDAVKAIFEDINKALLHENTDGDFLLSICIWGAADVRSWGKNMGNISRTSDDINPTWSRMLTNFDSTVTRPLYAHPGSWNDPDMLFIGKGEFDSAHLTEAKSHFALWAIANAPLFMGTDLRTTPQSLMDVFGNSAIISINQDPGGHQAVVAYDSDDVQMLVKTLERGGKAIAILNRTAAASVVTLTSDHLKFESKSDIVLTDLWSGREHKFRDETTFTLAPHQTLIFRAQGSRKLPNGLYLSEQPGNVNPAVDGVRYPQADPGIHRSAASWAGTKGKGERPMYAGWGGAQADAAPFGQVLSISGKPLDAGLGILANSRFEVRNKGYRRFETLVGIDDSASDKTNAVTFSVYGDGKLLASSSPRKWGAQAEKMSVNVAGVDIIELVARSTGVQNELLPVTWGEAALLK